MLHALKNWGFSIKTGKEAPVWVADFETETQEGV